MLPSALRHPSVLRHRFGGRARAIVSGIAAVAVIATAAVSLPASADPDDGGGTSSSSTTEPQTAAEAKQAWLHAADESEAASEDLLAAKQQEKKAKQDVVDAKVTVAQATLKVNTTKAAAVAASAHYADIRGQLAQFASASFRGGRLAHLSALLTADSSADYLDEVSSLDQVAGSTRELMVQALKAKQATDAAENAATNAEHDAQQAREKAGEVLDSAHQATEKVAKEKASFDKHAKEYHKLYSSLSAKERRAAMEAQQREWEHQAEQQAAKRAAEQEVERQATPDTQQGTLRSLSGSSSSDADSDAGESDGGTSSKAAIAVKAALTKLGLPYVWGARGPNAFDCSGLTSWAWAQAGVTIPRSSRGQASLPTVPLDQLQPGDLITYYSPVHHVALYIGNGQIVQASTAGVPIYITSMYRGGPYPVGHRVNR